MGFYNDGTIKYQGFKKTRQRHGEWIFYTYEGFVREVVIYENGSYVDKIYCDYENPAKPISKYYLLFGIGNSVKKLYEKNICEAILPHRTLHEEALHLRPACDLPGYGRSALFRPVRIAPDPIHFIYKKRGRPCSGGPLVLRYSVLFTVAFPAVCIPSAQSS